MLLLFTCFVFSQNRTFKGMVTDTLNAPLDYANIIAKPTDSSGSLLFVAADEDGNFELSLVSKYTYELQVTYIGYLSQTKTIHPEDSVSFLPFKLQTDGNLLDEIVITYDYQPIVIKKDTLIFDAAAFAKGEDRKLNDLLNRMPGVEVGTDGTVKVQGKKVNKLLVENALFFGGGTKLGVENIPADAVKSVEVIDHFSEVGFMKQVSNSEELVLNVKLKENRKKLIFGDLEAGAEVANDNDFYLLHAALFYYEPKFNINFIGNANTLGKRVFTFSDLTNFTGGGSSFLSSKPSLANLDSFTNNQTDVSKNKSQFAALNASYKKQNSFDISSFLLFSKVFLKNDTESNRTFLQQSATEFERQTQSSANDHVLGMWNTRLNYKINPRNQVFYTANASFGDANQKTELQSMASAQNLMFDLSTVTSSFDFKQFAEWHTAIGKNWFQTTVLQTDLKHLKPESQWISNQPFLGDLLSLQESSTYQIQQIKELNFSEWSGLHKIYWVVSDKSQLDLDLGFTHTKVDYTSQEGQRLDTDEYLDFAAIGFSNRLDFKMLDAFVGIKYKYKTKRWEHRPALFWHQYHLNIVQNTQNDIKKGILLPQWTSRWQISRYKSMQFSYSKRVDFADATQYATGKTLATYQRIYQGNALLENESFHQFSFNLSKSSLIGGWNYYALANYINKEKTLRNEVLFDGINSVQQMVLTDLPEDLFSLVGNLSKPFYHFRPALQAGGNWSKYYQKLNDTYEQYQNQTQYAGLNVKTLFVHWPTFTVGFTQTFRQLDGVQKLKYQSQRWEGSLKHSIKKKWYFDASYEYFNNKSLRMSAENYQLLHAKISYTPEKSPWTMECSGQNILGNPEKIQNNISDYIISETKFRVMPRAVLVSIKYKI